MTFTNSEVNSTKSSRTRRHDAIWLLCWIEKMTLKCQDSTVKKIPARSKRALQMIAKGYRQLKRCAQCWIRVYFASHDVLPIREAIPTRHTGFPQTEVPIALAQVPVLKCDTKVCRFPRERKLNGHFRAASIDHVYSAVYLTNWALENRVDQDRCEAALHAESWTQHGWCSRNDKTLQIRPG